MKKSKKLIGFLFLLFLLLAFTGCTNNNSDEFEENGNETSELSPFFPASLGNHWSYLGDGMEYASFTREIIYVDGNRFQVMEDNGGTVSANVFLVTSDAVTRVFFQGEEYEMEDRLNEPDNDATILLKSPIEAGTKWTHDNQSREIVDVNASVTTPLGVFDECIKVQILTPDSEMFEYYKKGVGLIKREFIFGDDIISSVLESFEIEPSD